MLKRLFSQCSPSINRLEVASPTTVFLLVPVVLLSFPALLLFLLYSTNKRYFAKLLEVRTELRDQMKTSYVFASDIAGYKSFVRDAEDQQNVLEKKMSRMYSREVIKDVWKFVGHLDAELFEVRFPRTYNLEYLMIDLPCA